MIEINPLLTGKTLGEFQVRGVIGRGGMAVTYRAYQPSMDREVALKVIRPELASDAGFVARFLQEVKIIARLEHPRILPVYASGQADGTIYLVMRLVEGGTLRDLIRQKSLAQVEVNRLVGQIASALDYAHARGVLHLDLKPTNVLIDLGGEAYLSDFGIARLMTGAGGRLLERVWGTPEYMSPEQCVGDAPDTRSDVYTLGVVLYELLTGKVPFTGETAEAILHQNLHAAVPLSPSLSPPLRAILWKALAKRKEERFASCATLAEALTATLAGLPWLADVSPAPGDDRPTIADEPVSASPVAEAPHPSAPPETSEARMGVRDAA